MVRAARQSRPQLVCVLADNSGSMAGEKAQAATRGIREMLMECQSRGPGRLDRSYFKLLLIRFDHEAVIDLLCAMTPVRRIDPDRVSIDGRGEFRGHMGGGIGGIPGTHGGIPGTHDLIRRIKSCVPGILILSPRSAGNVAGLERDEATTFWISAGGETIDVLNDSVMPLAIALVAAKEFLLSNKLPQSVEWLEL